MMKVKMNEERQSGTALISVSVLSEMKVEAV